MKPTWERDGVRLYLADCRDVLPHLEGVDAVVTDPPYGIAFIKGPSGGTGSYRGSKQSAQQSRGNTRLEGDNEPFDPSHLSSFGNVMMFGANHFAKRLPDGGRWLAWDKLEGLESFDSFSDVEFIWHSQGGKASRICSYMWKGGLACRKNGEDNGRRSHPTQKPIGLMLWCLAQSGIAAGGTILDPYMGSGSTGVACVRSGRNFIGIEIEKKHFDTAVERVTDELDRAPLFAEQQTQVELFD